MKIGIIKETKTPPDPRVPLYPQWCKKVMADYPGTVVVVQSSPHRHIKDEEYTKAGISVVDNVDDCDVLFGVKEVAIDALIPGKTYFFFSHTIKKQSYNQALLKAILKKKIRLIDYECLIDERGVGAIHFSRWAGIVGAHNSLYTWGKRTGKFTLPRLYQLNGLAEAKASSCYSKMDLAGVRIVITGTGRVSKGASELLDYIGIRKITPSQFISETDDPNAPVYCTLPADHLFIKDGPVAWDTEFFSDPSSYHSITGPYVTRADILINGIYWDSRCKPLFSIEEMRKPEFRVKVIGDVTCDIAPIASIPSTIRPCKIPDPVYGFDLSTGKECKPYTHGVDVMAVDTLPAEVASDASEDFGRMLVENVFPDFMADGPMAKEASIAENGHLTEKFAYLQNFVN